MPSISRATSKGAHGPPGSAIVILGPTLNSVSTIPPIGLVPLLSIDRFIGMARARGTPIGSGVATAMIGACENDPDVDWRGNCWRLRRLRSDQRQCGGCTRG
ncbi:MAG TPA: hypothetical protein VGC09_21840 [Rhodopila sp.]